MNYETPWQPTDYDLAWTRKLIAGSGTEITLWGVIANHAIYMIDRPSRCMTLVHGPKDGFKGCNLFLMLDTILPKLGWKVQEATAGAAMSKDEAVAFWKQRDAV